MRLTHAAWFIALGLGLVIAVSGAGLAQTAPATAGPQDGKAAQAQSSTASPVVTMPATAADATALHCRPAGQEYQPLDEKRDCSGGTGTTAQPAAVKPTYTVPAGTKVLLQLRSAINTKSAKPGDGVYLISTFPVVIGNRVMIPPGVFVQGVIDRVTRGGHMKGRAQLDLHFTSMIFPNNTVVEIPGVINSLPGAKDHTVKGDEGTVEENGNKGHDVGEAAKVGLAGATIGTIGGAAAGHPLEGGLIGGLGGVAVGAVAALLSRGPDIAITSGTPVEMVLQRPLVLEEENLAANNSAGTTMAPAANQSKVLGKPPQQDSLLCPLGTLGCQ